MQNEKSRKLIFIGAPGSGKTFLSEAYGKSRGKTVFGIDKEFTRRYGQINAYFEACGEKEFRKREHELMIEAVRTDCDIIDCGGGAVLDKTAMARFREAGTVVRLKAPESVLVERISSSDRPLKALGKLLAERENLYARYADHTLDTACGDAAELSEKLDVLLKKPRANRYDTVLCDADDTVLDFRRAMRFAIIETANELGVDRSEQAVLSAYEKILPDVWGRLERGELDREQLARTRFEMLAEMLGVKFDWKDFNDAYMRNIKTTRYVLDGAAEFLDGLSRRGINVYIITNSYKAVAEERLKAISEHVKGCFISEDVGCDKPDIRFFERVHSALGSPDKSRTIVFGDGVYPDIHGGNVFGVDTCLFDPSGKKRSDAVYSVGSYGEFSDLV